jgi:hypothetical protein
MIAVEPIVTLRCFQHPVSTYYVSGASGSQAQLLIGTTLFGDLTFDRPTNANARLVDVMAYPTPFGSWLTTAHETYCPDCLTEYPESYRIASEFDIDAMNKDRETTADRERNDATIKAALRCYQLFLEGSLRASDYHTSHDLGMDLLDVATNAGEFAAPTSADIDAIIQDRS